VLVMNLDSGKSLTPEQQKLVLEVGREAQTKMRELTESVDNFQKAKEILEPKGMKVNQADVASFRKMAEEKIWPQYRSSTRRCGTRSSARAETRTAVARRRAAGARSDAQQDEEQWPTSVHRCRKHGQPDGRTTC
jgi:TRAP-type C4-dicarboxylate transport system substrate-binding protein